jgi:hypothetical protein
VDARNYTMLDTTSALHDFPSTPDTTCPVPPTPPSSTPDPTATFRQFWDDLDYEDRLEQILAHWPQAAWFSDDAYDTFAAFRRIPHVWGRIKAVGKDCRVNVWDLEKAVDAVLLAEQAARAREHPPGTPAPDAATPSIWEQAITVQDLLAQPDPEVVAAVRDLVIPGAITLVAAPRGSGKSLVALQLGVALATGSVFRGDCLQQRRVLLIDRDNPPYLVKKRLRHLGAHAVTHMKVLTRDQAPPLTDKEAWKHFPVEQYDVIIVDSLGASTEGVSEKEGRQTQEYLATLKDLAHRGPGVLCLDNTNKAATNYRGRGEKADAVDILYEARDVTGWTPTQGGVWWEHLPEYGEHTWQQRASRHKGQQVLRIAFIPSKFRLGVEPEPFCLEIDTRQEPWTLSDITDAIATAGETNAQAARDQARRALDAAAYALVAILRTYPPEHPMLKLEAEIELRAHQLSVRQAKNVLERGYNRDVTPEGLWTLRPIPGTKGNAIGVYLAGEEESVRNNDNSKSPSTITTQDTLISYTRSTPSVRNMTSLTPSNGAVSEVPDFVHLSTSGCTKSDASIARNGAPKMEGDYFVHQGTHTHDIPGQSAPGADALAPSAAGLHHVAPDLWYTTPTAGAACPTCHGQDLQPAALRPSVCRRCLDSQGEGGIDRQGPVPF